MGNRQMISYTQLWEKMKGYARKVGRVSVRPVLLLYYVMKSEQTPKSDKLLICSTLSYLVLPVDILDARRLPLLGWLDEIAAVSVAYKKICRHITPEIEAEVDAVLDRWFADYTPYELITD